MLDMPVTTNPIMIMAINMSIVFGVLFLLGNVIRLLSYIDPTRKRSNVKS